MPRNGLQLIGEAVNRDLHESARRILRTRAQLAAWVVARDLGVSSSQSDAVAAAALDGALALLEQWGREPDDEPGHSAVGGAEGPTKKIIEEG